MQGAENEHLSNCRSYFFRTLLGAAALTAGNAGRVNMIDKLQSCRWEGGQNAMPRLSVRKSAWHELLRQVRHSAREPLSEVWL